MLNTAKKDNVPMVITFNGKLQTITYSQGGYNDFDNLPEASYRVQPPAHH